MNKRWIPFAAIAVVLLVAAGFFFQAQDEEGTDLIVQPERGPFQVTVTTSGELRAKNSVKIQGPQGAQQAGIYRMTIQTLVPEGTVVEKGDFVAEIDQSELSGKVRDAQIALQKAQSQHEQAELDTLMTLSKARDEAVNLRYAMEEAKIRKEQSVYEAPTVKRQAEIDYEKAERAYNQHLENYTTQEAQSRAKMREVGAELSKAQKDLGDLSAVSQRFRITAPEAGMVVYKREWNGQKLTTGGQISPWDPVVAELPDLSTMESVTYVNEVDIQKIREGQRVEIGLDASSDKKLTGEVTNVANIGEQRPNSDAKVFEVSILVSESDTTLRPAMTTSNTVIVAEVPDVLHVPLETIHTQDSLTYVFARRGVGAVRQEVELGMMNENEAVVQAGLDTDDRVYLTLPADTSGIPLRRLEGPSEEALASQE